MSSDAKDKENRESGKDRIGDVEVKTEEPITEQPHDHQPLEDDYHLYSEQNVDNQLHPSPTFEGIQAIDNENISVDSTSSPGNPPLLPSDNHQDAQDPTSMKSETRELPHLDADPDHGAIISRESGKDRIGDVEVKTEEPITEQPHDHQPLEDDYHLYSEQNVDNQLHPSPTFEGIQAIDNENISVDSTSSPGNPPLLPSDNHQDAQDPTSMKSETREVPHLDADPDHGALISRESGKDRIGDVEVKIEPITEQPHDHQPLEDDPDHFHLYSEQNVDNQLHPSPTFEGIQAIDNENISVDSTSSPGNPPLLPSDNHQDAQDPTSMKSETREVPHLDADPDHGAIISRESGKDRIGDVEVKTEPITEQPHDHQPLEDDPDHFHLYSELNVDNQLHPSPTFEGIQAIDNENISVDSTSSPGNPPLLPSDNHQDAQDPTSMKSETREVPHLDADPDHGAIISRESGKDRIGDVEVKTEPITEQPHDHQPLEDDYHLYSEQNVDNQLHPSPTFEGIQAIDNENISVDSTSSPGNPPLLPSDNRQDAQDPTSMKSETREVPHLDADPDHGAIISRESGKDRIGDVEVKTEEPITEQPHDHQPLEDDYHLYSEQNVDNQLHPSPTFEGIHAINNENISVDSTSSPGNPPLLPSDNHQDAETPQTTKNGNLSPKQLFLLDGNQMSEGTESGTEEEQSAFMKELEFFFKERGMEFKPPKFYGEGLNCLKLWRAVMRLGSYDKVTSCKLWRQVGESFKPPKTCTSVSWTFRGFYEKALLDYERHNIHGGELNMHISSQAEPMSVDNQASGSGRARRDAAARAMEGWHSQRLLGNGEVSVPIIKDKSSVSLQKRENKLKSLGLRKRKEPPYIEHAVKAARTKASKPQLDITVVDIGPPADWVKINVQKTKECFEVYALVPGFLREEVKVQVDPAGRLVISGEPENSNNPWGVTAFKKVVSLPARIDPQNTSAVVTLHGQLFVRVPFEESD